MMNVPGMRKMDPFGDKCCREDSKRDWMTVWSGCRAFTCEFCGCRWYKEDGDLNLYCNVIVEKMKKRHRRSNEKDDQ